MIIPQEYLIRLALRTSLRLLVTAFAGGGVAGAAELAKIAEIPIPGEPLTSFDISFIDQKSQRYYFADRSNKAIDIFDAKASKFIGRVAGFVGAVPKDDGTCCNNARSGPNGVIVVDNEVWAGDGDSTIKVIDLKTMKIVDTIPTGGKLRANELTYDPKDRIVIIGNQNDEPAFTTFVSTKPGHKVIGKVSFPDATDGNEQPTYNPADGLVYQSIPELNKDEKKGAVAVLDPKAAKLVKMLPVDDCNPAGLAFGPKGNFVLGCNADGNKMPAIITIMNAKTGKVVANVPDIGGADMVDYNKKNNQYYIAARNLKGGPVLGVIDAGTNKLVQKIPITGGNPHSVASSEANGYVFFPVGKQNGGCGCIQVYAPQ
jgi:DNA-binding beta-propeller fold protein YncE